MANCIEMTGWFNTKFEAFPEKKQDQILLVIDKANQKLEEILNSQKTINSEYSKGPKNPEYGKEFTAQYRENLQAILKNIPARPGRKSHLIRDTLRKYFGVHAHPELTFTKILEHTSKCCGVSEEMLLSLRTGKYTNRKAAFSRIAAIVYFYLVSGDLSYAGLNDHIRYHWKTSSGPYPYTLYSFLFKETLTPVDEVINQLHQAWKNILWDSKGNPKLGISKEQLVEIYERDE